MFANQELYISDANFAIDPEEISPNFEPHQIQGIRAQKQIFDALANWGGYNGEWTKEQGSFVYVKGKHSPHDWEFHRNNGVIDYFDAKTHGVNSKYYSCSLNQKISWYRYVRDGHNFFIFGGINVSERIVRIEGLWGYGSLNIEESVFKEKGHQDKPTYRFKAPHVSRNLLRQHSQIRWLVL